MLYSFSKNQGLAFGVVPFNLTDIAQDLYQLVYRHAFESSRSITGLVERRTHGMAHVSRTALIGTAGYNLMASLGIEGLDSLDDKHRTEELQLIQIALLLHDSGAESDAKDTHDLDSGLNLYHYLTERLGVTKEKAKIVAEAMCNKDWIPGKPYSILDTEIPEKFIQQAETIQNPFSQQLNRLRLAIQFGDSIDFQRTGKPFKTELLLLYNQKYHDPVINQKIHDLTHEILRENLSVTINFRLEMNKRVLGGLDCNGDYAFEFALMDMKDKAPLTSFLYQEGRALKKGTVLTPEHEKNNKPFYFKTLRADEACFWADFLYNLIEGAPSELRPIQREAYTSRLANNQKYEVVPTHKKHPDRKPLFTAKQKAETTPAQSVSYANPSKNYLPAAFGHDKRSLLVGIKIPCSEAEGIYTRRISMYDSGTIGRTFEGSDKQELENEVNLKLNQKTYHTSLTSLEEAGMADQEKHNEIMARIRWVENKDDYKIMIFSDNLESRVLAQARAWDIHFSIVERRKKQGLPFKGDYRPKIEFYPSQANYSLPEQLNDLNQKKTILAKVVDSLVYGREISLEDKCVYLRDEGKNFSRNLNRKVMGESFEEIFKLYQTNPTRYPISFEFAVDALPVDDLMQILITKNHPANTAVTSEIVSKGAKLGSLLFRMNPSDWEKLLLNRHFYMSLRARLAISADMTDIFLKLPKPLWRKLLESQPFFESITKPDQTGMTPLSYVCDDKKVPVLKMEMIESLLEAGASADIKTAEDISPLQYACAHSDMDLVTLCIENGANINEVGSYGVSALAIALMKNNDAIARLLIDRNRTINTPDDAGQTALHHAARHGKIKIIEYLLQHKALINAQDIAGRTPLHEAAQYASSETVKLLLRNGADVNIKDSGGYTPMVYALKSASPSTEVLEELLRAGADVNSIGDDEQTIFLLACKTAAESILLTMLPQVNNLNAQNKSDETALHIALAQKKFILAKILIDKGVDLTLRSIDNKTPFHMACEAGDVELFEILLNKGGDPHEPIEGQNETPFMLACSRGCLDIALELLNLKVDINAQNINGASALHLVCKSGNLQLLGVLLTNGANPFLTDTFGKTPFEYLIDESLGEPNYNLAAAFVELRPEVIKKFPCKLEGFPQEHWPRLLSCLPSEMAGKMITSAPAFITLLNGLPGESQGKLLVYMGGDLLLSLFPSVQELSFGFIQLPQDQYLTILEHLGPKNLSTLFDSGLDAVFIAEKLPEDSRFPFLKLLGSEKLSSLIMTKEYARLFQLIEFLKLVQSEDRMELINFLGPNILKDIIKDQTDYNQMATYLPVDAQSGLIERLGNKNIIPLPVASSEPAPPASPKTTRR